MFFGKLVAGAIGYFVAGFPGLLLGALVGHMFDRGLQQTMGRGNPQHLEQVRTTFFETCFLLLGNVAKADGRVSEDEIAHAEEVMQQLGVFEDQRQRAIDLFQQGSSAEFELQPALAQFNETCRWQRQLPQTLLVFLMSMALADGDFDQQERAVLQAVASELGYNATRFAQLLEMVMAQSHFHAGSAPQATADQLDDAYRALGIAADCNERDLKRAYRKLMSQHHPDKLIAQGVPEQMIKLATEKAQEIQSAYELIKKSRAA